MRRGWAGDVRHARQRTRVAARSSSETGLAVLRQQRVRGDDRHVRCGSASATRHRPVRQEAMTTWKSLCCHDVGAVGSCWSRQGMFQGMAASSATARRGDLRVVHRGQQHCDVSRNRTVVICCDGNNSTRGKSRLCHALSRRPLLYSTNPPAGHAFPPLPRPPVPIVLQLCFGASPMMTRPSSARRFRPPGPSGP